MHFIQLCLADKTALYTIYMPYIEQGGLFIAQESLSEPIRFYALGLKIHLLLTIQSSAQRWPMIGQVAWASHTDVLHGIGIGIQLHEGQQALLEYVDHWQSGSDQD